MSGVELCIFLNSKNIRIIVVVEIVVLLNFE